jgi:tRNA (cmo5U34)-methyltransferase
MNLHQVRAHFESEAFAYDSLIDRLVPYYKQQHEVMLAVIPFDNSTKLTALDLGCGTGVLSHLLLSNFPRAQVTALDLAANMLDACRSNLANYADRLTLQQGNFAEEDIGAGYDIVISGLATHHLHTAGKQQLYGKIFAALNPGGLFLNREIVLGDSDALTDQYHTLWRQYIALHGEDDAKWFANYQSEDIPATVADQLTWLHAAGFTDPACHWRYLNFAVFGGRKP